MKNKKAFTLIELLVVIAVLAGMIALLVPNYMQVRMKSRDVRRKNDLKTIQKALELYKQSQSLPIYPAAGAVSAAIAPTYMKTFPVDSAPGYLYLPVADSNGNLTTYDLWACLENVGDSEKVACPTPPGGYTCSTSACYHLSTP